MSGDIILLMRTNLPPHRRGLSPTELKGIRHLAPHYPQKSQSLRQVRAERTMAGGAASAMRGAASRPDRLSPRISHGFHLRLR